ncbi:M42 family metallopeptidase [Alicyclobacillus sp. TC]|uniref:M42 family metallopeptidase n=1 Tax=Alicyclobacillus sp. TC TaxID=2606450 RepID=UPI001931F271|nr:M42 family metallopeptidase [Alicyclobacillus sp. TC]QRF24027.1 M42 family metallopeptidase [Alicyclobacillus sp. TC]
MLFSQEDLQYTQDFLLRLLNIPSPTGMTKTAIDFVEAEAKKLGIQSTRTHKGALCFTIQGKQSESSRLLTAHVDTLGGMIKEILPSGQMRIQKIGGYAWSTIEGETCRIFSEKKTFTGTVLLENTSVHVNSKVNETERTADNMVIVLDEVVHSAEDVKKLGISVGDFIAWDPRAVLTESGYIKSRHLDDKASVAILFGVVHALQRNNRELAVDCTFLISNNEEIGYGGNSNIPQQTVEYVAVDMGAIGKGQTTDEHSVSICAMDGSGPYHFGLRQHLVHIAQQHQLHYAVDIYPHYSSDASAAVRSGADIKHGLVGPGVANSHTYERLHSDALIHTSELLIHYLQSPLCEV